MSTAFPSPILVCTLGAQPQVVTLCLDLLKRAGRWSSELVVVHTSPELDPVHSALAQLDPVLAAWPGLSYRYVTVTGDDGPTPDLSTDAEAAAYLRTLYRVRTPERPPGH